MPAVKRWNGSTWEIISGTPAAPANMVTTDTTQTVVGHKTFTTGVELTTTVVDGNAALTTYPLGLSVVTMGQDRAGFVNWPGFGPATVLTYRSSTTGYQHMTNGTAAFYRGSWNGVWDSWSQVVDSANFLYAKGRMVAGNASGEPVSVNSGLRGQVLTADPDYTAGVTWKHPGTLVPEAVTGNTVMYDTGVVVIANGTLTITLPWVDVQPGGQIVVKNVGTGTVTIARGPDNTSLIDGATTRVLNVQYSALSVVSDGTNWHII